MTSIQSDIVVLNSRQRTSGSTQNATYNLVNIGGVKGTYELMDYHSTNQTYNVEVGVNDTVYWTEPGALSAVVPPGSYTVATYLAAATIVMDAASGSTFTLTQAVDTGLVTVAITAGTFSWDWVGNTQRGNELLGLQPVNTGAAASHVGTSPPNMVLHTHIIISIPQDGTKAVTIMNGTEFSAVVPLPNFGQPINFVIGTAYSQLLSFNPNNFTIINVELYTEDGVALATAPEYVLMLRKVFD